MDTGHPVGYPGEAGQGRVPADSMLTKIRYSPRDLFLWTRWETLLFTAYALGITALYQVAGLDFLQLPWTPVAVIGTAVAFMVGFQNNAAYGRIWEARKIWGGIVNASRTFGMKVQDMVSGERATQPVGEAELVTLRRDLVHRHLAWLTALRHAMRQPRPWEAFDKHWTNREWSRRIHVPERSSTLEDDLAAYLSEEERRAVLGRNNTPAAILYNQSRALKALERRGLVWEFAFLELENLLQELFTLQGQSERIKNFPYPRQYATMSFQFVWVFVLLLPYAAIPEFAALGERLAGEWPTVGPHLTWVAVPFCTIVSWVFHLMERIGRVGENPFEGSANDVPISTIARGIEIDLLQGLGAPSEELPAPFPSIVNVQM